MGRVTEFFHLVENPSSDVFLCYYSDNGEAKAYRKLYKPKKGYDENQLTLF